MAEPLSYNLQTRDDGLEVPQWEVQDSEDTSRRA
jgi:hypothetical protein